MKIFLYNFIGDFDSTASDVKNQIEEAGKEPIELHINSPGGNVFEGFAIYNLLRSIDNEVIVNIDGLAGSIASLIALSGDTVNMSEVGDFFIHNASTFAGGNKELLEDQIKILAQIDATLLKVYQKKTGQKKSIIQDLMEAETHFTAKEALKLGFIDNIVNPIKAVALLNNNNMKKEDFDKMISKAKALLGIEEPIDEDQKKLVAAMHEAAEKKAKEAAQARIDEAKGGKAAEILTANMVTFKEFEAYKNVYTPLMKTLLNTLEQMPTTEQMEAIIKEKVEAELLIALAAIRSKTVAPRSAGNGLPEQPEEVKDDHKDWNEKQKEIQENKS